MSELDKYYQILGLNPGASEKEIIEAYKVLVKVWSPDRFSDDPNIQKIAAEKIREIDEAFKQLLIGIGSPPEKGREIQESQSGLRTEPPAGGSVVIQTEPLEAKVYFNEKFVGTSPCKGKHLTVGSYKVRVIKEGYKIWEQDVDIYAGAEKKVFAKLKLIEPESGQLWKDPYTEMEFIYVKGGWFEMGDTFGDGRSDEQPVHKVFLDDFYIGKYQVTQEQWERVMGNNPSEFKNGGNYPVEFVSWYDVGEFIKRLNKKTGMEYRLPTEAEWEYSAKSGEKGEKWSGTSSVSELMEYAWEGGNSNNQTHPVGQKKPNSFGLHDLSGNVNEWVQDWYDRDYYRNSPMNNPCSEHGLNRVIRGGRWNSGVKSLRTSSRSCIAPHTSFGTGFRLVHPAQPEQTSIAKKEQPPAPGEKPYGTESSVSQPDSTNLEPKSYVSLRPTVHKDEGRADVQSVKPTHGGLGVGTKVGLTVMGPSGIGGWLFCLVAGLLVLGPLLGAGRISADIMTAENQYPALKSLPQWGNFKAITWWTFFAFAALSFYGGWGLARGKDWSVVKRAKYVLWLAGPVGVLVMGVIVPIATLGELGIAEEHFWRALIGTIISAGIWTAYMSKSKRVHNTYGPPN